MSLEKRFTLLLQFAFLLIAILWTLIWIMHLHNTQSHYYWFKYIASAFWRKYLLIWHKTFHYHIQEIFSQVYLLIIQMSISNELLKNNFSTSKKTLEKVQWRLKMNGMKIRNQFFTFDIFFSTFQSSQKKFFSTC